jgi:hypothetical protein
LGHPVALPTVSSKLQEGRYFLQTGGITSLAVFSDPFPGQKMQVHLLTAPVILVIWAFIHPSTNRAQRCLSSVIKWVTVCPTWQVFQYRFAPNRVSFGSLGRSSRNSSSRPVPVKRGENAAQLDSCRFHSSSARGPFVLAARFKHLPIYELTPKKLLGGRISRARSRDDTGTMLQDFTQGCHFWLNIAAKRQLSSAKDQSGIPERAREVKTRIYKYQVAADGHGEGFTKIA